MSDWWVCLGRRLLIGSSMLYLKVNTWLRMKLLNLKWKKGGGGWQHLYRRLVSPDRITFFTLQTLFKPDRPCPGDYLQKPFTARVTVTGINLKDGTGVEQGLCVQREGRGSTLTSYKLPRQGSNEISQREKCAHDPWREEDELRRN